MLQYVDSIIFMVATALAFVFIDQLDNSISPILSLFIMSLMSALWFSIINYRNLHNVWKMCIKHKMSYAYVAVSISGNWLCSIFAPNLSDPFIYLSVLFISMAICGLIHEMLNNKTNTLSIISVVVLLFCLSIVWFFYRIRTGHSLVLGMCIGIIGGITTYMYFICSGAFQKITSFSSTQILAVRFLPLICGLAVYLYANHLFNLNIRQFAEVSAVGVAALILPVFFLQQSIKKLGAIRCSWVTSATPICVFIVYSLASLSWNMVNMLICILITISLVLPKITFSYFLTRPVD